MRPWYGMKGRWYCRTVTETLRAVVSVLILSASQSTIVESYLEQVLGQPIDLRFVGEETIYISLLTI